MSQDNKPVNEERKLLINKTLKDMGILAECVGYDIGPTYTRFNIKYKKDEKVKNLSSIIPDLRVRLGLSYLRFVPSIPNEPYSGIEIVNEHREFIDYDNIYSKLNNNPMSIPFGVDNKGKLIQEDLCVLPHVLVTGTTGSGKSIFLHSLLTTLIKRNTPSDVQFVLIDPKYVETYPYKELPHLYRPIINKPKEALEALCSLVQKMNDRYVLFEKEEVCSIKEYNDTHKDKLPYIVVVIDEYMDLYDSVNDVKSPLLSLLQKGRASGIHIILSMQRIDIGALSKAMKDNFPTVVAFATITDTDSIIAINDPSAEYLGGLGDMLLKSPTISRKELLRLQAPYIKSSMVKELVDSLKDKYKPSNPLPVNPVPTIIDSDDIYEKVKKWALEQEYISPSKIQRECSVGFNRAHRVFERLQKDGLVSPEMDKKKGFKVNK